MLRLFLNVQALTMFLSGANHSSSNVKKMALPLVQFCDPDYFYTDPDPYPSFKMSECLLGSLPFVKKKSIANLLFKIFLLKFVP
jgi:hypothetical protein